MFIKPEQMDEAKILETKKLLIDTAKIIDEIGLDAYARMAAQSMTREEKLIFSSATTNLSLLWQDEIR